MRDAAIAALAGEATAEEIRLFFGKLEKKIVRERIVNGKPRIDGRDLNDRSSDRLGSGFPAERARFGPVHPRRNAGDRGRHARHRTRCADHRRAGGRVQGRVHAALQLSALLGGRGGRIGAPGRREIGHGRLARRGVAAMLPSVDDFPYSIRVVSEITESNGSSSMATVCGASLAMMDAGIPIKAPVAGIAMGLVKEGNKFAVITDILGDEDHLGDMDFKVAGSAEGVTALQMDIKIQGITEEIMEAALDQARHARLHILGEMSRAITKSRDNVSDHAPQMVMIRIDTDKIRDVIGKGGATIRGITDETGASIDIYDDGTVRIYGENATSRDAALARVQAITAEAKVGEIYTGTVARIVDFGAFVTILPGKDGLVHISQIANRRIENVSDVLKEGQEVRVKVLDVDPRGRIKLSMKELDEEGGEGAGYQGD